MDFAYTARDARGQKITGSLTAANSREASATLATRGLFPITIEQRGTTDTSIRTKKVAGSKLAVFYVQLASLLKSGVPLLRGLQVLSQQSGSPVLQSVLSEVRNRVEDGESLADAFARYPRVFDKVAVAMVRAGSEGGFLEDALERVGNFIELQEELKGKTMGALAYPAFISAAGALIITVLMIFFVPNFASVFETMRERGTLPMATIILLAISETMQAYWWLLLIIFVAAGLGFRAYLQTPTGAYNADRWKIKLPLLGPVLLNLAVARFCRVLGTMLDNGVSLLKALDISKAATNNQILSETVASAVEEVTSGERLAKPLARSGHFPTIVTEMISVAEESNALDKVLVQISDNLEKTTYRRLEIVVRLLEPMMLLFLAAIVMFIVLALMYPILTSNRAFG